MKLFLLPIVACLVASAFAKEAPLPPNVQDLVNKLQAAGCEFENVELNMERSNGSVLPNCWNDRLVFTIKSIAPKGGQIFFTSRSSYGESIAAHYLSYPALVGPYVYRSKDGKIVAQLNSGLTPAQAEKFEAVITAYTAP